MLTLKHDAALIKVCLTERIFVRRDNAKGLHRRHVFMRVGFLVL